MPRLCLIVFLACLGVPSLLAGTWPGVPYAEVRAYAWPATEGEPLDKLISDRGKLLPGVLNPKGALLSKDQVRRLLATQRRRVETRRTVSACYDPHNLFVFFDRRGRMVAFLEICFDCRNTRARPEDERADPDLPALAAIFSELKLPFGGQTSLEELRKMDRAARGLEEPEAPAEDSAPKPKE